MNDNELWKQAVTHMNLPANLISGSQELQAWLNEKALPLWHQKGLDRPDGGFYERIGQNGEPMLDDNRRARVQPRQAYCFIAAGKAGWKGEWREAADRGLSWFDQVYRLENGLYGNLADRDGKLIDPSFDLYNQAFALFAAATLATADESRFDEMRQRAEGILATLREVYSHPVTGFEEASPPREPLCSNPHMHLFEAALAWEDAAKGAGPWTALADEIANLCMNSFIDSESGGLREFFDRDWNPMPGEKGRIMEPGHQFEWAWLLVRWGKLRGNDKAIEAAKRLFDIGESHGICPRRKVAIMSLNDDFSVHDGLARLWPQTEWLKAALQLLTISTGSEQERYAQSAIDALAALKPFLATPLEGLWFDKWPSEGSMIDEPAPASTFYHIACAIYEMQAILES